MPSILIDQIYNLALPFVTAVIGYFGGQFLPGFTNEYFAERARKARHKLDVAIQVHKICMEAGTGKFKIAPRDIEHINSVLSNLEAVDEKMAVKMSEMVSSWRNIAGGHILMGALNR